MFNYGDTNNLNWIKVETFTPFGEKFGMYQRGVISHIIRSRPEAVIIFANPRYISFWMILILGRILKIPVYPRGHGLYKKPDASLVQKVIFSLMLRLGSKYICYTPSVYHSIRRFAPGEHALGIGYNTIYSHCPVAPIEKKGGENGIFFIGRLRQRCGIEILIQALEYLHQSGKLNIQLHVIGSGEQSEYVKQKSRDHKWLIYHEMIFDEESISNISKDCRIGCYAGDMGLSVVHMMSLSLPSLTHSDLASHMGPEPSYIEDRKNGWFYEPAYNFEALAKAIEEIWVLPQKDICNLQNNAFETYQRLSNPPFHVRMLKLIE